MEKKVGVRHVVDVGVDVRKCGNAAVIFWFHFGRWPRGIDGKGTCGRLQLAPAMQAGLTVRLWKLEDLFEAVMAA